MINDFRMVKLEATVHKYRIAAPKKMAKSRQNLPFNYEECDFTIMLISKTVLSALEQKQPFD